jgi:hypothetical protein
MNRAIDIDKDFEKLNPWVRQSINLFNETSYLDEIGQIYDYSLGEHDEIEEDLRRKIRTAHNNRNDSELIRLLSQLGKFPYDEPFWFLLKNIDGFIEKNPQQVQRITHNLYRLTDLELVETIESESKLNQQTGPMFETWLKSNFEIKGIEQFKENEHGIVILGENEEIGEKFVKQELNQTVSKRPDLVAKVDNRYVIGEAKWIGGSGGNQNKSVTEVLDFCSETRGSVLRIGIVDGYPWATMKSGRLINNKICVRVQESTYNLMSALLLEEYFQTLLN